MGVPNEWGSRRTTRAALLALSALVVMGCGGRTWPVSGKVVFPDGSPVTSGVIEFAPAEGGGPAARGAIGPDGTFDLITGKERGAAAGRYRVAVVQLGLADGYPGNVRPNHRHNRDPKAPRFVDESFGRFETSGLERTVEPDKDNHFVIEVEPSR
jgi:hypothetical protein